MSESVVPLEVNKSLISSSNVTYPWDIVPLGRSNCLTEEEVDSMKLTLPKWDATTELNRYVSSSSNSGIGLRIRNTYDDIEELIQMGANINNTEVNGYTPLMISVLNNELEYVQTLLHFGADIHVKNSNGESITDMIKNNNINITKVIKDILTNI